MIRMNKAILIHETKGCIEEIYLDISQIYLLLGGSQTFIGQWPDIDVVILKAEMASTKNANELPYPFNNEEVYGKVLLVRMDEHSEPQDFTLEEYESFRNRDERLPV